MEKFTDGSGRSDHSFAKYVKRACVGLQRRKGARTSQTDDRRSLHVVSEAHVSDETTAHIRTHVAGAGACCEEIDILHGGSGSAHAVQNRTATCLHGTLQIAHIQLIGVLVRIQSAFQVKWRYSMSLFRKIRRMRSL